MTKNLRIVAIGGGTGLPVLLAGLGNEPGVDLSAIVSVSDNGGSSGRLRESFAMPAVGDLRNCMVALCADNSAFADIFQHRFSGGGALEGHSVGNLIVAALYQKMGSLTQAIEFANQLMPMKGRAFAATESSSTLCAAFDDGVVVRGESHITAYGRAIQRVWLEPEKPPASPGVLEAIRSAHAIVLAPGSLYTSLIPNLLVSGVADSIRRSAAVRILVCNLMTQPGETDGYTASDHLRAVAEYLGHGAIDFCLVNRSSARWRAGTCRASGAEPVACDPRKIRALGAIPVKEHFLLREGEHLRHNPAKLGNLVARMARARAGQAVQNEQLQTSNGVVFECLP